MEKANNYHRLRHTAAYRSWKSMRTRCNNPNEKSYKDYGGRGITVCKRWDSFVNFYTDMGERPEGDFSLDRIDNNGNYEPSNCRWATREQQNRNHRIYSSNKSGTPGVHWNKRDQHWVATIKHQGRAVALGVRRQKEDAIRLRKEAEAVYWGRRQET